MSNEIIWFDSNESITIWNLLVKFGNDWLFIKSLSDWVLIKKQWWLYKMDYESFIKFVTWMQWWFKLWQCLYCWAKNIREYVERCWPYEDDVLYFWKYQPTTYQKIYCNECNCLLKTKKLLISKNK
jgi:hypothetical protein